MPLHIQSITPDLVSKRAFVTIWNDDPQSNDQVQLNFVMHFTGQETLSQAAQMAKDRSKAILQDALRLL